MKKITNEIEGTILIIYTSLERKEVVKFVNKKTRSRKWYICDFGINYYKLKHKIIK